jgi:endonuclease YncB( thermonuclease family)
VFVGLLLLVSFAVSAQTVYVTKAGQKYHAAGCRFLTKGSVAIDLSDAITHGYTPCKVCNPSFDGHARSAEAGSRAFIAATPRAPTAGVRELSGKVVAVHDGDTLTVLVASVQHKIRLNGIDAPELGQNYGRRARQFLSDLCFGTIVTVRVVNVDRYGREVGDVVVGGVLANAELVRAGLAWHYKQYSKDPALAALEKEARAARRGLWVDRNPTAPWDYRHGK